MTLFHTTERLGKVQSVTKEGFLICEGVPVSRTGVLVYAPGELPIPPGPDGLIRVSRSEDAVFNEASISSFEGKSVVDLHPGVDVTPANWRRFAVGHMQNVRRGTGDQDQVLLADLIIKDAAAIREVRAGKRHCSLGYDASYSITAPGFADQSNILGNHVALVPQGRCGPTCSIGDKSMTTQATQRTWMDRIRSAFTAQDETMLAAALAEAPTAGTSGGGTVVNLHTTGHTRDEAPAVNKEVAELVKATADAMGLMNTSLKNLDAKFNALDQKVATIVTKDGEREDAAAKEAAEKAEAAKAKADEAAAEKAKADEDEAKKAKAKTGDAATKDSANLAAAFKDCVSRAEILIPGVAIPTFDSKALATDTEATLCGFRRKVLTSAQAAGPNQAHVNALLPAGSNLAGMTCDAVGLVFQGATELARASNNRTVGTNSIKDSGTAKGPLSPAEINERNRKYYYPNSK